MNISTLYETKFLSLYDLEYKEGRHYYDVSRRKADNLMCAKSDEEFKSSLPDAVSIITVLNVKGEEPVLVLSYEYRYPTGQFLLSPPAGLIDPEDINASPTNSDIVSFEKNDSNSPLIKTAIRELKEELGLDIEKNDKVSVVSSLLFSTPGMTDESNGLVLVELFRDKMPDINQDGAEGSELFDGFVLVTKDDAKEILSRGRDNRGNYYSIFTWAVLNQFIHM